MSSILSVSSIEPQDYQGLRKFPGVAFFLHFFLPETLSQKSQKCPEMGPSLPCANHIWYQRGLNILLHTALSLGVTPILASQTVEIYRKIWLNSLLFFLHFSSQVSKTRQIILEDIDSSFDFLFSNINGVFNLSFELEAGICISELVIVIHRRWTLFLPIR